MSWKRSYTQFMIKCTVIVPVGRVCGTQCFCLPIMNEAFWLSAPYPHTCRSRWGLKLTVLTETQCPKVETLSIHIHIRIHCTPALRELFF
uniref:Uncharacterized protein n=1 Tax=Anguilla anguilla TaxID=7936 RepID=A0A0E9Q2C7_ANGAN